MNLKPSILCHPNIPKPLHGVSPREIKGQAWWDKTRKEVYASTDFHCVACGIHKSLAKKHQWLEAHEFWDIDYSTGVCKISSIEPLCHYCHNFIHSGRLAMILNKEKDQTEVIDILEHGFKILRDNNLQCFPGTFELAKAIKAKTFGVTPYPLKANKSLKWGDYMLIFEDTVYYPKYKTEEQWYNAYKHKG